MNEEKEHVAEFTAALFRLTHEPCRKKPINICRFRPGPFQPQAHLRNAAGTRLARIGASCGIPPSRVVNNRDITGY